MTDRFGPSGLLLRLPLRRLCHLNPPFLERFLHKLLEQTAGDEPTLNAGSAKRPPQCRLDSKADPYFHR